MKYFIVIIFSLFSLQSFAQIGRSIGDVTYYHSTVGTTAQDAIPAVNIQRVKGWRICHDSDSTANYLAISAGVDPATDGVRIGAGACFICDECGSKVLENANVKADAAATGYSVLQLK